MVIGEGGHYVAFPSSEDLHFQILDVATGKLGRPSAIEDGSFLSFSPDGTRYVTIDDTGRLRVWARDTGAVLADSQGSRRVFSSFPPGPKAVFTPDGRHIVAFQVDASEDDPDHLVVLDASTLASVGGESVLVGSKARAVSVAPDGRTAVVVVSSASADNTETKVVIVDLETREIVRSTPIEPFGEPFSGARNDTVSPDGRTVGIGAFYGNAVVVDAVTGKVTPLPHAHDSLVESVTFAPDYTSFVTTGQDGAVKLWDFATHDLLGSILPLGPNHVVRASYLAADRLLMVFDTGEILEWDPRVDSWEAYACSVAGRNLTKAEWVELFPGQAYRVTCPEFSAGE
jgi:WD40 repeat protein